MAPTRFLFGSHTFPTKAQGGPVSFNPFLYCSERFDKPLRPSVRKEGRKGVSIDKQNPRKNKKQAVFSGASGARARAAAAAGREGGREGGKEGLSPIAAAPYPSAAKAAPSRKVP